MCRLCDNIWLGMRNPRWSNKHWDGDIRMFGVWKARYNQYFPANPLERVNRSVSYNSKECNEKRFR